MALLVDERSLARLLDDTFDDDSKSSVIAKIEPFFTAPAKFGDVSRGSPIPHKLPEAIRVVDGLPLTPMQKVDRATLAAEEARTSEPQPDAS